MELGPGVEDLRERYLRIDGKRAIVWRSPPKGWSAARPRKLLQGLHRRRMLVIIEEANEIPPSLWTEATTAVVSGGVSHVLAILNPTDTGTPAHQATESGAWTVVPIGVDDTPNFTGEVGVRSGTQCAADAGMGGGTAAGVDSWRVPRSCAGRVAGAQRIRAHRA